jgi:hypothetical protein
MDVSIYFSLVGAVAPRPVVVAPVVGGAEVPSVEVEGAVLVPGAAFLSSANLSLETVEKIQI